MLKHVPSVNVDIDGNVTLRNASPTIFVDGRPTTLTLDQIPADAIQTVEIITNPSAKFDASGGTAGILNIVLKKNRKAGYSGNFRAGVDERGKLNLGGDVNIRQGKVNVFANANFNQRKSISNGTTDRLTFPNTDSTTHLVQNDNNTNVGSFEFGRLGLDYFLDNRNTITLSGSYGQGKFNSQDEIYLVTDTLLDSGTSSSNAIRTTTNDRSFHNTGGSLQYKHLFPTDGKDWTADLNYNQSTSNSSGIFNTNYYDMQQSLTAVSLQKQTGGGINRFITAQTDFEDPVNDKIKIEAGARAAIRNITSENHVFLFDDSLNEYLEVPNLNNYDYNDQVYAAYGTFSSKIKKLQYQAGLRIESSFYTGKLTDENESFSNNFPA